MTCPQTQHSVVFLFLQLHLFERLLFQYSKLERGFLALKSRLFSQISKLSKTALACFSAFSLFFSKICQLFFIIRLHFFNFVQEFFPFCRVSILFLSCLELKKVNVTDFRKKFPSFIIFIRNFKKRKQFQKTRFHSSVSFETKLFLWPKKTPRTFHPRKLLYFQQYKLSRRIRMILKSNSM